MQNYTILLSMQHYNTDPCYIHIYGKYRHWVISPLPEKLHSIQKMLATKTPKEVKQFLGLIGYYRKFIPRFSDLAQPLNALTRKDVEFKWASICQESFELLKASLMTEPILTYPDPNLPYVLFKDTSKYVWACVLNLNFTPYYIHEWIV